MFPTSTQMKFWTFPNNSEIERLRQEANDRYVQANSAIYTANDPETEKDELLKYSFFLSASEEAKIRRHYEQILKDFCSNFEPPMPKYVTGTAMCFFKRIYLHCSVMDYHPKDLLYTCVYLACKIEEFNLSVHQFIANMKDHFKQAAGDLILSQELLIMQMLHYHLTVHNPYRPVEGLLIDIKTRCPEIHNPERLRDGIDKFLDAALLTDVALLFAPSQIALAAVLTSASNLGLSHDLNLYVANKLIDSDDRDALKKIIEQVQKIRTMVKSVPEGSVGNVDEMERLLDKLNLCRNQDNNPDSVIYHQRQEEAVDDNEERRQQKRLRLAADQEDNLMEDEDEEASTGFP